MKKLYIAPKSVLVIINEADIIATSPTPPATLDKDGNGSFGIDEGGNHVGDFGVKKQGWSDDDMW